MGSKAWSMKDKTEEELNALAESTSPPFSPDKMIGINPDLTNKAIEVSNPASPKFHYDTDKLSPPTLMSFKPCSTMGK